MSIYVCLDQKYATADFANLAVQHSRTSSSASSAGSSYVSSTDSNKDSPTRKVSPAHSRQSSHSSASQRQCENDRNILNATNHQTGNHYLHHQPHHHQQMLPHYQLRLNEQLRGDFYSGDEHNDEYECDDETISMKSLSPSAFSRKGGVGGSGGTDQFDHPSLLDGCQFRQQPSQTTDAIPLYGTIRPHNNHQKHQSNGNSIKPTEDAMPAPAAEINSNLSESKELNYRTLNGDLIRSVQPPGKGIALPYKVGA